MINIKQKHRSQKKRLKFMLNLFKDIRFLFGLMYLFFSMKIILLRKDLLNKIKKFINNYRKSNRNI